MEAPKCRLCGEVHWPSVPHKFKADPKPVKEARSVKKPGPVLDKASEFERLKAIVEGRRSYMRDYMRKRRAKV